MKGCLASVERLKQGPADWESIMTSNQTYIDQEFYRDHQLQWFGFNGIKGIKKYFEYREGFKNNTFSWQRFGTKYPLFGNGIADLQQGSAATCYIMAAMGAISEFPEMRDKVFLTKEANEAGIYAVQFYVRGKPWVVTVDDEMLYHNDSLYFSQLGDNDSIWSAILEKACI